ncbi:sugar ABC transporter ATP-binding protein [Paracoccus alkanivorans]|uniref:Sugar ABC transporter ATP-binding protein n=1 Tax=Paracoccus alkanivorans TaxID=2116655 RepID=A0A3M0N2J5_9RHOB|nr:sugar ABC transporter ATP-binding protein [Paracoccus alkanivorans]RMC37967.1 sugar ABC transporter ATP-binding protein [Paracoccus alkanivorans]
MAVTLSDIVMDFPGTRALDHVSAEFRFDEVHGLVGENGAGKSTFVNVLGGSLRSTEGQLALDGQQIRLDSPHDALLRGIAHVSQEGSLVPTLTGAENIMLGAEPRLPGGIMRRRALRSSAQEVAKKWFPQLDLPLDRPVIDLPMAERKVIEILRALRGNIRLLILDEPTATLEAREKRQLWEIIRSLPQNGVGVVLISHFLSEVVELSDRITVLRDGRQVATLDRSEVSEAKLTDLMLRREAGMAASDQRPVAAPAETGECVLSLRNWQAGSVVMPEFDLHSGEIVGLIGLTGAGHFGFARSLYTHQGVASGSIFVGGQAVAGKGIRVMQRAGVALVPDHRMENALAGDGSVVENLSMVHPQFAASRGVINRRRERAEAARIIGQLNVKTPSQNQLIRNLSGGNKQKVSIGKWLYGAGDRYRVLIFIEPTEGVDIGAKREIYTLMRQLAARGAAILIASSDLGEIAQVCHRAIPFVHGSPQPGISAGEFSESRFISAISGEAA